MSVPKLHDDMQLRFRQRIASCRSREGYGRDMICLRWASTVDIAGKKKPYTTLLQ